MRAAPDLKPERGKIDGLVVGDAEHVKICDVGEHAVVIDRVGNRRVVVARQHARPAGRRRDDGCGLREQIVRQTVAVEGVAGEQHDVGADVAGRPQYAGEPGGAVAAMEPRGIVVVDVEIGAVNDDDVA